MFSKILVLNRGEIAVRIIRTCREMGIKTVAVYANGDEECEYVKLSDEAYSLSGTTAAESFLNTEKILDVIERAKPDAIHPGYGFYSENADFVNQVTEKGVTWIGPSAKAIELMGDKLSARHVAIDGGVPVVPGDNKPVEDIQEIFDFGNKHGWPIAIKASFGGGGRGMKVVNSKEEVESAYDSATREALNYFGNPSVYIEKYLVKPRHLEVQIFSDSHGNFVWLGTRDCSVQRRYQKLIEEAPAPYISAETEKLMGEAAINAAKKCGYTNAGTVEFLFVNNAKTNTEEFYFLEMNTRLQVEHCVSEEITGYDFVREQINVALGKELSFTQDDYSPRSHSIEIRINAENPSLGFTPSPGKIEKIDVAQGLGIRYDGGYKNGDTISQNFDNLIGKLIATAPTREESIKKLICAIDETKITGVATTIKAQQKMLQHHDFHEGKHHTKWVEEDLDFSNLDDSPALDNTDSDQVAKEKKTILTEVNGKRFEVNVWVDPTEFNSKTQGTSARSNSRKKKKTFSSSATSDDSVLTAPMQGTIIDIKVSSGDEFKKGDVLCILEAMKMENQLKATKDGKIKEVKISEGDGVGSGDELITFE